ncbi:MAG: protein-L-isoaspartate(D-aspartate) O-methyltransferase [Epsilonproteobacteria bacterium]|nr:protein-L-isoaspartate(D-aspartate) O-methyltransferase [Campylobacterota bacterium]
MIANTQMVEKLNQIFPLTPEIKNAFLQIDRKEFVPKGLEFKAYIIDALPLANDSTISSPLTVAKMTTYLEIDKSVDSVLEIGCGSGYQAAILSKLIRRVFAVERINTLVKEAKERFRRLKIYNVNLKYDDGLNGWNNFAPFDRILFSASIAEIPPSLFQQLAPNGILLAPIDKGDKEVITQFKKVDDKIIKKEIQEAKFVPIKSGKA